MGISFLDCSDEVSAIQASPTSPRHWLASDISESNWIVPVSAQMRDELFQLAEYVESNPLQNLQRKIAYLELPHSEAAMGRMRFILEHGVGFALLDRLNVDQFHSDTLVEIYWLLGQFIGRPVAQKWNGQMVYDVCDTGTEFQYGVRGSHTSVELVFHVDNAFAKMVPDYVGLLCRNTAKQGGISRFCSLYTVHDRMQKQYPLLLERLYQPMFFDRQKEHAEGASKICLAPYFSWKEDRLNARANSSLVRKGYEIAEEPMDKLLLDALNAVDEICSNDEIWFEGLLQRGQIQYLNNHEVGHYRSEFIDFDEPEKKRHLYRLWHRERGSACYDGGVF